MRLVARERAEINARNRHHVERRRVVLGDMQAVHAAGVGRLGELEAFVEQQRERTLAVLDMVEKPNLHGSPASCLGSPRRPHLRGSCLPHPP
jgi:hypothetical protein